MQTSEHGNKQGFSVVEASISLFIAGFLLLAVLGSVVVSMKYTDKILKEAENNIQALNDYSRESLQNAL